VDLPNSEARWLALKDTGYKLIDLAELPTTVRGDSGDFKPLAGRLLPIASRETLIEDRQVAV
jgi:hypothetical protein